MIINADTQRDLGIVAALATRELRQRGVSVDVAASDFTIVPEARYGRPDVHMRLVMGRGQDVAIRCDWSDDDERSLSNLVQMASDLTETVADLIRRKDDLVVSLASARKVLKRELARTARRGLKYPLLRSGLHMVDANSRTFPAFVATIQVLGKSLVPEDYHLPIDEPEEIREELDHMADQQERRLIMRTALASVGADGMIDEVAIRLIQRSGRDIKTVLAALPAAESGILDVDILLEGKGGMVLFWEDGMVHANARIGEGVSWRKGNITIDTPPKRFARQPVGRSVRDVLKDETFPPELKVSRSTRSTDKAQLSVTPVYRRFNASTGLVW
jgi:hypothetical protein